MSGDDYCRNLGRWMSCPPPLLERNLFLSDSGGGRSEEDGGGARWFNADGDDGDTLLKLEFMFSGGDSEFGNISTHRSFRGRRCSEVGMRW
jgi:hypothetical protein